MYKNVYTKVPTILLIGGTSIQATILASENVAIQWHCLKVMREKSFGIVWQIYCKSDWLW